ncbi:smalltalk protein [Prevotella sp.]
MAQVNLTPWKILFKVIIAVATALLGALGADSMTNE